MKNKATCIKIVILFIAICWSKEVSYGFDTTTVMITEFLAVNSSIIGDEDGDSTDWIEFYNPTNAPINLNGWFLSDDVSEPLKWKFPNVTINAKDYMVVFASSKNKIDSSSTLHTNFKLSSGGENIILTKPNMQDVVFAFVQDYPVQYKDISYGIVGDEFTYLDVPTPGAPNIAGTFLPPPVFSVERGFFKSSFTVELNSDVSGCTIKYTTDGSDPSKAGSQEYSVPISINTTTCLRALSIKDGFDTSIIMTHTYFFIDSILRQPANPKGYPSQWGYTTFSSTDRVNADYEMDPDIIDDPAFASLFDSAMLSIPSLSVVTDEGNLFSLDSSETTGGIYIYTGPPLTNVPPTSGYGDGWVRPASVEYIVPNSNRGFQVNCGLSLHGGHSRRAEKDPKHSLRLRFSSEYGPGKLNFNLFKGESEDVKKFNTLVLRGGFNYSWLHNSGGQRYAAQYIQDTWMKDSQRAMGWHSAYNTFVHLYLNGLYWGLYNISEKPNDDYMESYLGGNKEDYDIIKDFAYVYRGSGILWDSIIALVSDTAALYTNYQILLGNNPDGTPNASYEPLLDAENFIDYMLLNFYGGNQDWDRHNWIASRNRVNPGNGFQLFVWDGEQNLISLSTSNLWSIDFSTGKCPTNIFYPLLMVDEFKILLGDRIQKHLYNKGSLTPTIAAERYKKRANEIELSMLGESARWGDYHDQVFKLKLYHWQNQRDYLMNTFFPGRTDWLIDELKNIMIYDLIDAPVFSQHGGIIDTNAMVSLSAPLGDIYYTMDGSDPRLFGGELSANVMLYSDSIMIDSNYTIKARAKDGDNWSALTEAQFEMGDPPVSVRPVIASIIENHMNYPNPFSDYTYINYYLPKAGNVDISIYSIDGRLITNLYTGHQQKGIQEIIWEPQDIQSGIYLYRISTTSGTATGKMIYRK